MQTSTKETNPKAQAGNLKVPLTQTSPLIALHSAPSAEAGNLKYGKHNYFDSPMSTDTLISAMERHLLLFKIGEDYDSDGFHHISAVLQNSSILLDQLAIGILIDSRAKLEPEQVESIKRWMTTMKDNVDKVRSVIHNQQQTEVK